MGGRESWSLSGIPPHSPRPSDGFSRSLICVPGSPIGRGGWSRQSSTSTATPRSSASSFRLPVKHTTRVLPRGPSEVRILYLCPDLGIPVLGRKGASVHVRELIAAFGRAGHSVVLAASLLNKSPWEEPANLETRLLHMPPAPAVVSAFDALKAFNKTLGIEGSLPGELRRILYDRDLVEQLKRRFENHAPDFIYERASLYSTAGVLLARELGRPLIMELNSPLSVEQATYRATGLGDLAARAERWALSRADAVLAVSTPLRDYAVSRGAEPYRLHYVPNGVDAELFKPGEPRSEERRVGKECRSRWSPYH